MDIKLILKCWIKLEGGRKPPFFFLTLFHIGVQSTNNVLLASGTQQSDSVTQVSILSKIHFRFWLLHNIEQRSLCYTEDHCWLFILNTAEHTC